MQYRRPLTVSCTQGQSLVVMRMGNIEWEMQCGSSGASGCAPSLAQIHGMKSGAIPAPICSGLAIAPGPSYRLS
jgi:hypothetical protein